MLSFLQRQPAGIFGNGCSHVEKEEVWGVAQSHGVAWWGSFCPRGSPRPFDLLVSPSVQATHSLGLDLGVTSSRKPPHHRSVSWLG